MTKTDIKATLKTAADEDAEGLEAIFPILTEHSDGSLEFLSLIHI